MGKHLRSSGLVLAVALASPLTATPIFSTGSPNGLIGTASRPSSPAGQEIETADDFVLSLSTLIDQATFTGLLPSGSPLSDISRVEIEFYHVFPADSAIPPSGAVPSRMNSPSDVEIGSATRDSADGSLTFTASLLNPAFTVANSVVRGIHPFPDQRTGGEGPVTGEEVQIRVEFTVPVDLAGGHYFFRPEALLTDGNFLWLSAPKPIVPPGTPFMPDLQTWIRNADLAPDWLRVGADIVGGSPAPTFNASFSLSGEQVPEPATFALVLGGLAIGALKAFRNTRRPRSSIQ